MKKEVDSRVLEKIRKLLSLAESDNEHEATIAMERANELILRHNLSVGDIADSDITSHETEMVKVVPKESKWINSILRKHFFVEVIEMRFHGGWTPTGRRILNRRYCYVGEPINIEIALYTDAFLRRAYKRLWQDYKALYGVSEKSRIAYYSGLTRGITDKLDAQKGKVQTETGLVWKGSAAIDRFIRKNVGETKKGPSTRYNRDEDASSAGREAGRNIELTRALKRNDHAAQSGRYLGS